MSLPQVLFFGLDLYKLGYVENLPAISEKKTFKRDKIGNNTFNVNCKNLDNFFSIGNSSSPLTNQVWLYKTIKVINEDGIVVWNGVVTNITLDQDSKKATIHSNDIIFSKRDEIIEYTSTDWETAGEAAKNIMDSVGFTNYNNKSIQDSINQLQAAGAYIKVNYIKTAGISLLRALEDLGEKSCSDVFSHYGNIYFKHYQVFEGGVSLYLNKDRNTLIKKKPNITYLTTEVINQYSIDYDGSEDTPYSDIANIGALSRSRYGIKSLNVFETGTEKAIIFKDIITAKYIGECYMYMTHRDLTKQPQPVEKIALDIDIKFKEYIDLEKYFKLDLIDNSWTGKEFEVYEFIRNDQSKNIKIVAYGV